jgi:UDP-N-acetyl-D-mannosaminuronic acid dehydrogenase
MATQPPGHICVVGGAGHVGLPLKLVLAEEGFSVNILDVNAGVLRRSLPVGCRSLNMGPRISFKRLLPTGRIGATTDPSVVKDAEIVICVIRTPVDEYLRPKMHTFFRVIGEISPHLHDEQTLILRSTVYPGLSQRFHGLSKERRSEQDIYFD